MAKKKRPTPHQLDRAIAHVAKELRSMPQPTQFESVPVLPLIKCRNVAEYFVASLGMPDPPNRIAELREEYPLESEVGKLCQDAIEAARVLTFHMRSAYGLGRDSDFVRQATLLVCEVYAFG